MKKLLSLILLSSAALTFQACQDDFLDVKTNESIVEEDFDKLYNNEAGAKALITSVYSSQLEWKTSSFAWIGLTSITSDDADKGSDPGDTGSDKDKLDNLDFTPSLPSFLDVFQGNFEGINRANVALHLLPTLDKVDSNLRNRLIGEAKFLKSLMYFNLVRSFGNVPLIEKFIDPSNPDYTAIMNTPKDKALIYANIEKDLTDAITLLTDKNALSGADKGRATVGAARALLAKVYLYQKKWNQVLEQVDKIQGYELVSDYATIWREIGEDNIESIFEIRGYAGSFSKGIENYYICQGARGNGGWGWGFNTPTHNLANSYEANDVRKDATIIFKGETLWDGRLVPNTVNNDMYNEKAYVSNTKETFNGDSHTSKNIRVLRFAEVLLMKAEALTELNNPQAVEALNQVRLRAGLQAITWTSQDQVRKAIYNERRHELAFEHDRWFDIVRTKQAKEVMAADGKTFIEGKHEVFPLPEKFVRESNGLAKQNSGY